MRWNGRKRVPGRKTPCFAWLPFYIKQHNKWIWLEKYAKGYDENNPELKERARGCGRSVEGWLQEYPMLAKGYRRNFLPEDCL